MGWYRRFVLPRAVHWACGLDTHMRQRAKVVPQARGRVLEVGVGSGLNLAFYDPSVVTKLWALEPSAPLLRMAERAPRAAALDVEFIGLPAEEISLDDASVDTVVVTYTLCTIPDVGAALRHMRRVLRPGGRLLFCEHGVAPDQRVRRWQDRLNPVWKPLAGGCNLNRPIPALIEAAGFRITKLDTMYLPGWRPAAFNYWGEAVPR
ncbi:MAG: class I SAM-dependent methyltransferase [Gemmatimonadota bacterium]|nr:class I SAM-dependent methyltransferase [Gemmatimonadota bacterium]MDE3126820.1 class I SAM-dependent methyltransferase [Gemmatimonadota bacterium]MDE3172655.1 class I SAM-dependent methyltransferase [Gemmatimonadota bacterium]MDE3216444.1 class I SAM-dependent methyltransferase [Gemmatimonadota bacterium]